jgi:hypothetical protein
VNLHLSFDGYKAIRMPEIPANYDEEEPHFTLVRMIPPGQLTYFYSVGEPNYMDEIGKDIKTILDQNNPVSKQKINVHCGQDRKVTIHVPRLNYIEGDIELFKNTLRSDDLYNLKGLPRAEPVVDVVEERPKSPWTFAKSFFSSYPADTEDLMASCFDFDWASSKIEKLSK